MRFRVEGHDGPSPAGNATLYVDETVAGALQIKIQPGHFSLAGEGINASRDAGQPVSSEYTTPYELTGGTLHEVALERTDDPFVDQELHLAAGFARDEKQRGSKRLYPSSRVTASGPCCGVSRGD